MFLISIVNSICKSNTIYPKEKKNEAVWAFLLIVSELKGKRI